MKVTLAVLVLFFMGFLSFGQNHSDVEENQFKINFLTPAFEYERGIGEQQTLDFYMGTAAVVRGGSETGTDYGIFPVMEFQYRYYYNLGRRVRKGKNISRNTGNFFGPFIDYTIGDSVLGGIDLGHNIFNLGAVYGLQRTFGKGFNYGIQTGVGYYDNEVDGGVGVFVEFSLGWVLGKK